MEDQAAGDRDFVASLEKGLLVIEAFDASRPRLTLSDVAKLTGITRAAARRYLRTLTKLNYADFDGRYFSLSPRILRLGYAYLSSRLALAAPAAVPREDLRGDGGIEFGGGAWMATTSSTSPAPPRVASCPSVLGSEAACPAYCTSLGRAILAYQSPDEIEAYLERVRLEARTPKTITRKADLRAVLEATRRQGYAMVNEELELGLRSIAVPLSRRTAKSPSR